MSSTAQMFVELEQEQKELEQERRATGLDRLEQVANDEARQVAGVTCEVDKLDQYLQGKQCLLAAERNQLQRLVWIIHYNPELVHFADADGYTPLHRASYNGHLDCVRYLVKHGANLEAKTNDDWTPLHCAVRWNNLEVAEFLIEHGADINAKSSGGNTPLHIAASNGRYLTTCDIIQMLLYHPDCDYWCRNQSGDTALNLAKRSGPFYKLWTGVMTIMPGDYDDCSPVPDEGLHRDAAT